MEYIVKGYEPKAVFEIFEDICAIPHGSGNERLLPTILRRMQIKGDFSFSVTKPVMFSSAKMQPKATRIPPQYFCRDTWTWSARRIPTPTTIFSVTP